MNLGLLDVGPPVELCTQKDFVEKTHSWFDGFGLYLGISTSPRCPPVKGKPLGLS